MTTEVIRRLIREGKIPEQEGWQLLEAFDSAESKDAVIREELQRIQVRSSRSRVAVVVSGIIGLVGCSMLFGGLMAARFQVPESTTAIDRTEMSADLTPRIEVLERQVKRRPGSAGDYRTLAQAYAQRAVRSGSSVDRQQAAEALARAEGLERRHGMKGNPLVFGAFFILVIMTAIVVWIMGMYNGLGKSDERINERWAQVETVLQRRLDLVPQLVETVKGYAAHERETLMAVTEARARVLGVLQATSGTAPKGRQATQELSRAQQELAGALRRILAVAEQYPDLKASSGFLALQDQLEGTENRIAVERQRYNDTVRAYNARLRVFPSNVVGALFGYEPRVYFESAAGAEIPVAVSL